jgi:putative DNA methylase
MIPKDCKRLAEVDFPIAEVSRHAVAENKIRHGHPKTLHLWWARRPLASSRAVLLALLWPDPCDVLCPVEFKTQARTLLPAVGGCDPGTTDEQLREALLKFIANFSNWDNATQRTYLEVSRALVQAAHGAEPPLVVDPFAGGGSIPLEALRLGCDAFATDLNPVACLILKAILEDVQRHGPKLGDELRTVGARIQKRAESDLSDVYPMDADGALPIAYLWARTVRCEAPNCGAEIPLVRSFWLSRKKTRRRLALRHRIVRKRGQVPCVEFEMFEPQADSGVPGPTVTSAKATCVCCGAVLPPQRVRAQLSTQRGGAEVVFDSKGTRAGGALLLAVVSIRHGESGRHYRLPNANDYDAVLKAQSRVAQILDLWERGGKHGICPVPDEVMNPVRPSPNARGLSGVTRYGMATFGDLFTGRQKLALVSLANAVGECASDKVQANAAMVVSKMADYGCSLCRWRATSECADALFGRQAIPMVWDFAEPCSAASAAGSWDSMAERSAAGLVSAYVGSKSGSVDIADATEHPLPDESAAVWFTDPPYYDAIPYADLSDFFLVWLKRALPGNPLLQDPFDRLNGLSPKDRECTWNRAYLYEGRPKDRAFFEKTIARAFSEGRRVLRSDGIGSVVFAHKTTEGWEAMLSGLIQGGWTITGSWPIATEMGARLLARDTAALATSVHLICRPRSDISEIGDWAKVLGALPRRVSDWMERLQGEGVRGADLVFACIGPALEIFSRYSKVETAEGREVFLAEYLEKVWEVVGRSALAQVLGTAEAKARNGAAGAVEEDARLTALFLWTLQSTDGETADDLKDQGEEEDASDEDDDEDGSSRGKAKGFTLVFDVVRRFAQPLGIELPKWEGRVIETRKGVVRLLPIAERAKQLFGEDGAQAVAARLEQRVALGTNPLQGMLFPDMQPSAAPSTRRRGRIRGTRGSVDVPDESLAAAREATTLDRVHTAMLLQAGGRTNALRALLKAEQERGPDFLRLANAFSALYPKGSEEKRLIDAMLLAVPR